MKKKILFAAYSLDVGGIETALISLINHLVEEYDITLVLEKKQGVFLDQADNRIKIVEYSPSYNKVKLFAKTINLKKRIGFSIKYKNKFDFACSYATYCQMASMVARKASKNNALWVHNNYYYFFDKDENNYKNFFDSISSHKFRNVLFVSDEARKQYINIYGVESENVLTCNNLIDSKKIYKLAEEEIQIKQDSSITTFVNISRHDEHQKRLTRLIECARLLEEDKKKFRILFIGDGNETELYKKMVDEYNLKDKVIFIGRTTNPYPYLKIADCVILTSDYEGYPVVYLESKILNKPIITTDVSDSKIDIENKYGIVTEKNVNSIYNSMKSFIRNGFEIKEKFDAEKYNNEIINKVKNIIDERN